MRDCGDFCTKLSALLADHKIKIENGSEYFCSAVLIPLTEIDGELSVLFEVRSAQLTWQPGEICFPGGRIEDDDADPMAAALRETAEELGVEAADLTVLGAFDYIVNPIGVVVFPCVGYIADKTVIRPNAGEVAEVFAVPLHYLLQAKPVEGYMEMATRPLPGFPFSLLPGNYPHDWKKRTKYPVLFYPYKNYVIWGLTARVLHSFLKLGRTLVGGR